MDLFAVDGLALSFWSSFRTAQRIGLIWPIVFACWARVWSRFPKQNLRLLLRSLGTNESIFWRTDIDV